MGSFGKLVSEGFEAGGAGRDLGGASGGGTLRSELHECPSVLSYSTRRGSGLKLGSGKWREGRSYFPGVGGNGWRADESVHEHGAWLHASRRFRECLPSRRSHQRDGTGTSSLRAAKSSGVVVRAQNCGSFS